MDRASYLLKTHQLWILAAALGCIGLLLPLPWMGAYIGLLWLVSTFFLGIPHGAADWLIHKHRITGNRLQSGLSFICVYLLVFGAYIGLWYLSAETACFLFLLMTVWHWGSGDSLDFKPYPVLWFIHAVAKGGFIILAPFVFHRNQTLEFIHRFPGMAGADLSFSAHPLLLGLILIIAICLCLYTRIRLSHCRSIRKNDFRYHAAELIVLLGIFYFLPPLLSIGIYFVAIHALRHSLRLIDRLRENTFGTQAYGLFKLHAASIICTLPVILGIILLLSLYPGNFTNIEDSVANYLVIIAGLTAPHALLITYWDFKEMNSSGLNTRQAIEL